MPVTWLEEREGKKARERRRRIRQTEFLRERAFFFGCVHFRPLSFHHLCSLLTTVVAAVMPYWCLDVKRMKVVIFSQNGGILRLFVSVATFRFRNLQMRLI